MIAIRSLYLRVFLSFWCTIAVITMGGHFVNRLLIESSLFRFFYRFDTGIPELFVAIGLSGLPCYFLARSLAGPIVRLRKATQELAQGNLAARAGKTLRNRKDEIGMLVGDFDHMADQLESIIKAQHRLIADISHELRSPLTRLGLALELARRHVGPDGANALKRAEREAKRLNELIGNLLTLALLESGSNAIQRYAIHLEDLVGEIVSDADFEARTQQKSVNISVMATCITMGNPDLLRSAIENVVRNAVQHTAEKTVVEVSVRVEGSGNNWTALIEVKDHGLGVPSADLPLLFRPFYRVESARARDCGGTGLGLAIAQQALSAHNGSISASNSPGSGLVVSIRIPAVSAIVNGFPPIPADS